MGRGEMEEEGEERRGRGRGVKGGKRREMGEEEGRGKRCERREKV